MDGMDYFSDVLENTSGDDLTYLMSTMWGKIEQDTKLKLLLMFYSDLTFNKQSEFFAFLGHCLNKDIYEASTNNGKKSSNLNFDNLIAAKKSTFIRVLTKDQKYLLTN